MMFQASKPIYLITQQLLQAPPRMIRVISAVHTLGGLMVQAALRLLAQVQRLLVAVAVVVVAEVLLQLQHP